MTMYQSLQQKFGHVLSRVAFPGLTIELGSDLVYLGEPPYEGAADHAYRYQLRVVAPLGSPWASQDLPKWNGRWWRLSEHMTTGEIVQTAFKAILTALEHEARERFTFDGVTVLDPHYDIHQLVALRKEGPDGGLKGRD